LPTGPGVIDEPGSARIAHRLRITIDLDRIEDQIHATLVRARRQNMHCRDHHLDTDIGFEFAQRAHSP
jgi:hypothetical protein